MKDFAPITVLTSAPDLLVVHPSLPVKSVKELIALAKARPGELNYAAGTPGSSNHLAAELFKSLASINMVLIPYKDTASQVTAMIGGHVQLAFLGASTVTPHLKSGKLKALGVASAQPSGHFPNLPTVASSLPFFEPVSVLGLFAHAKTPRRS